jgi:hypothetical protein
MFNILTNFPVNASKLKHSLVRRAFKIKELIDKYNEYKFLRIYKAEQLTNSFNTVGVLAGPDGLNNNPSVSIVRRITTLLELEHDAAAVKLIAKYMDNGVLDPRHKYTNAEIGELLFSWINTYTDTHEPEKSGDELYNIYYGHLSDILVSAVLHRCTLTVNYILEHDITAVTDIAIHKIDKFLNNTSVKEFKSYINIVIKLIGTIANAETDNPSSYNNLNILIDHVNTLDYMKLLFDTVTNYNKLIFIPYYTMYATDPSVKPTEKGLVSCKAYIPLYYLYLRRIMIIYRSNYKQFVADAFNMLVKHNLHTTSLMRCNKNTLHIIPYLCKEYIDNTKAHVWSLGKLLSMISKHEPIKYPIHNNNTITILMRALDINNTAVVKLIITYIYPEHRPEHTIPFIISANNPIWFVTLLDSLPYPVPAHILDIKTDDPTRPRLRDMLPKHIVSRIEANQRVNTVNNANGSPSANESELSNEYYNNEDRLLEMKYAHLIQKMTAKSGKRIHRMSKKKGFNN